MPPPKKAGPKKSPAKKTAGSEARIVPIGEEPEAGSEMEVVEEIHEQARMIARLAAEAMGEEGKTYAKEVRETFLEFAAPVIESITDEEELHAALVFCIAAWNISLFDEKAHDSMISEMFQGQESLEEIREMLHEFIHDKEEYFPDWEDYILEHEVVQKKGKSHIEIYACPLDFMTHMMGQCECHDHEGGRGHVHDHDHDHDHGSGPCKNHGEPKAKKPAKGH